MKAGTVLKIILGLIVVAGAAYLAKPELYAKLAASVTGSGARVESSEWADPEALRDKLADEIEKKLEGNISEKRVQQFLSEEGNRLRLLQWMVAQSEAASAKGLQEDEEKRSKEISRLKEEIAQMQQSLPEGSEKLTKTNRAANNLKQKKERLAALEKEAKARHTLLEVVNTPGGSKLMEQLGNEEAWLEQVAVTGECVRPGVTASILAQLVAKDSAILKEPLSRDIATATAVEFAKSGWLQADALKRARYYLKHSRNGRLNTVFNDLPFWERRMVCGCKGDNDFGSVESLQWSLDNVHLPAYQYDGCCWRCGYKLYNLFGMIIHGSGYVEPFTETHGKNRTRFTYEVGGVCGGLSHFGAFSALANGVPALTAGEPGHCSYIVRVGDQWKPSYSLSWERGLHWQVWKDIYVFSQLHAASEMFSDAQREKTRLSNAYRVLGGIRAQKKDLKKAAQCYEKATTAQPLHFAAWRDWAQLLSEQAADPKPAHISAWRKLNDAICNRLTPRYPELAAVLLQKHVYPAMAKAMADDPTALRSCMIQFWKNVREMGPDRWRIEELANDQAKALEINEKTPDRLCDFFGDILGSVASTDAYPPVILSWGNSFTEKLAEKDKKKLLAAMTSGLGKGASANADARDNAIAQAILAAEKAHDLTTFQALGKMLSPAYLKADYKLPSHTPFPGKLASKGGMMWASSTSQWDHPCAHWGITDPALGGHFHTGKDTDAWVVVQLPRQVHVTGIVIVGTTGNTQRLHNMKVQVSETGKDDDWHDVADLGPFKNRLITIDLTSTLPLAKYVRIVRQKGPDFFHLNGIFVYGNQAA